MSNFWNSVVLPLLEVIKPNNILQIGSRTKFNHSLLNFSIKNKSLVDIYEISSYDLDLGNYRNRYGNIFEFYVHTPFEKLITSNSYDVIFIDGNQSFSQITNYLNLIFKYCSFVDFPVIIFFNISNDYNYYGGDLFDFYKIDYRSNFVNKNIKSSVLDSIYEIINMYKEFSFFYTSIYDGLGIFFLDNYYTDIKLKEKLKNSTFFDFFINFNNLKNIPIIKDNFQGSENKLIENFPIKFHENLFINSEEMRHVSLFSYQNNFLSFKNKLLSKFNFKNNVPLISILVINDGEIDFLKNLFNNFDLKSSCQNYEILILNKNFSDDSINFLKSLNLPIKLIDNCGSSSSINKNNLVNHAKGNFLCFLNGYILPNEGWLDRLMEVYSLKNNIGIVGSCILFENINYNVDSCDYKKQILPFNLKNENFFNYFNEMDDFIPSAFLVDKYKFLEIGGFNTEYCDGIEDIDLSLNFIKNGFFNYNSTKSLFDQYMSDTSSFTVSNFTKNKIKDVFSRNWKLFLKKVSFLDKFYGSKLYIKEKFKILFVVSYSFLNIFKSSSFLELVSNNWEYEIIYDKNDFFEDNLYDVDDIDLLISFTSNYDFNKLKCNDVIKIFWVIDDECLTNFVDSDITIISNSLDRDFLLENYAIDSYIIDRDVFDQSVSLDVLELNFNFFKDIIIDYMSKIKILIKIGSPNWIDIKGWGDYHFALSLKKELENFGCLVKIQVLSEWSDFNYLYDVILVLRGLSIYNTQQQHFNIMWNISHPDAISNKEYESYDQIFVASDFWAKKISDELSVPVSPLLQCTDENLFFNEFNERYSHDLLFVGNSRLVYRKILKDLDLDELNKKGIDLGIYGGDWEQFIPKKYINGNYIPNVELHKVYSSSKILLNDHWEDMAKLGFISNRIFDGFASNTFLLSDYVTGIEHVFGDAVVTYSNEDELNNLINLYLNDDNLRAEKINNGKNIVLKNHTFKQRAKFLFNFINDYL